MTRFTPNEAMVASARQGLQWRKEFGRGGTAVGVARARDISHQKPLPLETVKRMHAFFSRHAVDKEAVGFRRGEEGFPSAGRIAWELWGGDAGRTWAKRIVNASKETVEVLADFRRLAGLNTQVGVGQRTKLHEQVRVGRRAEVNPETGIASGKVGRLLTIDGGWAQLLTADNEFVWVPVSHLTMLEATALRKEAPFLANLWKIALKNDDFRRVVYTGKRVQFTVMSLPPGEDIGLETHDNVEQVFFCVQGSGTTSLNGEEWRFSEGDVLVVPPGTAHNITNDGSEPLKFFTSYTPPNHLPNVVHRTKADAEADVADEKFGQKVARRSK